MPAMRQRKRKSESFGGWRNRFEPDARSVAPNEFDIRVDENMIRLVKLLARQKAEEDFARATRKKPH